MTACDSRDRRAPRRRPLWWLAFVLIPWVTSTTGCDSGGKLDDAKQAVLDLKERFFPADLGDPEASDPSGEFISFEEPGTDRGAPRKTAPATGAPAKTPAESATAQKAAQLFVQGKTAMESGDAQAGLLAIRDAAHAGHAEAQLHLGGFYQLGAIVKQDYAAAAEWFRKAASQGSVMGLVSLADCYRTGTGVEQDYEKHLYYLKIASQGGDPLALNRLGMAYQEGWGVPKHYETALAYYRRTANAGDPEGMMRLGIMYEKGYGLPADARQAARLYEIAASREYPTARVALGSLYASGGPNLSKDTALAAQHLTEVFKGQDLPALIELAWVYATHPEPKIRDAGLALRLADRLTAMMPDDYSIKEIKAAAQARAGDFTGAEKTQKEAINRFGATVAPTTARDSEEAEEMDERLKLYATRQPYTELEGD